MRYYNAIPQRILMGLEEGFPEIDFDAIDFEGDGLLSVFANHVAQQALFMETGKYIWEWKRFHPRRIKQRKNQYP